MFRHISREYYTSSVDENSYYLPVAVDTTCPHCKRKVNFSFKWVNGRTKKVEFTNATCPGCKYTVLFIYLARAFNNGNSFEGDLYIHPGDETRQPLSGIEEAEKLPDNIRKAYFSTINVLNAQEWTATSVLCRRVLEGVIKQIVPDNQKNKPLAAQLIELPKHIDLTKPILTLADAIRKGGNLGAHFDDEKEPNSEIASMMVDVLDYLIEYLFILPSRIQNLHDTIENISATGE